MTRAEVEQQAVDLREEGINYAADMLLALLALLEAKEAAASPDVLRQLVQKWPRETALCCGRAECGGECGNEWRGMKPVEADEFAYLLTRDVAELEPADATSPNTLLVDQATLHDIAQGRFVEMAKRHAGELESALAAPPGSLGHGESGEELMAREVRAAYLAAATPSPQRAMAGARTACHAEEPGLLTRALEIGERLRTQDNRITNLPMFAVQQRVRIYGLDPEYADHVVWLDCCNDYGEASPEEHAKFEALHDDGEDVADWQRTGYRDTWEFVTCCLTEQGCKDYLKVNGHNLKEPRIYAYIGFRNAEWEFLRNYFLAAASPATQREEDHSIPPSDCSGDPTNCPDNEGTGCYCSDLATRPHHNDGQEDAALDLLEAAKNTLYGIFKGDPHATHNAANMRNRIDVFLQGRQIDRLAARQQPVAATDWRVCRTCNGTGHQLHTSDAQCETCKGRGIEAAPKVATDTSGTEAHPEDFCELCKGRNIKPWFAPNEIWNQAVGEKYDILCPQCFVTLAEASGVVCTGWELRPEVLP